MEAEIVFFIFLSRAFEILFGCGGVALLCIGSLFGSS
jgi:hypothetical protein